VLASELTDQVPHCDLINRSQWLLLLSLCCVSSVIETLVLRLLTLPLSVTHSLCDLLLLLSCSLCVGFQGIHEKAPWEYGSSAGDPQGRDSTGVRLAPLRLRRGERTGGKGAREGPRWVLGWSAAHEAVLLCTVLNVSFCSRRIGPLPGRATAWLRRGTGAFVHKCTAKIVRSVVLRWPGLH